MPSKKAGIVYFTGRAARLVITTIASDIMAPIIRGKIAPLNKIADMVTGKKMADMAVMDMPTQAIRFFSSLFIHSSKLVKKWLWFLCACRFW